MYVCAYLPTRMRSVRSTSPPLRHPPTSRLQTSVRPVPPIPQLACFARARLGSIRCNKQQTNERTDGRNRLADFRDACGFTPFSARQTLRRSPLPPPPPPRGCVPGGGRYTVLRCDDDSKQHLPLQRRVLPVSRVYRCVNNTTRIRRSYVLTYIRVCASVAPPTGSLIARKGRCTPPRWTTGQYISDV